MISRTVAALAVIASIGLHVAGLALGVFGEETQIEATAGAAEVAVGNSFADMAVGTLTSQVVSETGPTLPADPDRQVVPDVTPTHQTPPVDPRRNQDVWAETAEVQRPTVEDARAERAKTPMTEAAMPSDVDQVVTVPITQAVSTTEVSRVELEDVAQAIASVDALTPAPTASRRPEARPASLIVEKPDPKPQHAAAARGNAQENAKAGTQAKPSQSKATAQGTNTTRDATQGNAAATNYPGKVMQKINRVPKPRMSARTAARVHFTIAGSGRLSGLSVAKSSGSARFDQAALRVIRRAAPFPAPPPGAQRSFSLTIKSD